MTITNNNDWIEWKWTPEKPYPETLDVMITVKFEDGDIETESVARWYGDGDSLSNNFASVRECFLRLITHYSLA